MTHRAIVSDPGPLKPVRRLPAGTFLQYLGFDHTGSVRTYRFRGHSRGEEPRDYVVKADLALFARHHVGIQEGPTLCLHRLMEHPDACGLPVRSGPDSLTDADMLAHLATRPAPKTKGWTKRILPEDDPAGA